MIYQSNYGTDLESTIVKAQKKLKEKTKPSSLLEPAPLAPDAVEPNTQEIASEIRTNKPAILKSNYDSKIDDAIIQAPKEKKAQKLDLDNEDDNSDKSAAESNDFVGAGMKTLDFVATAATKKQAMGRKERNAQTMNLVGKGASAGAAIGSVVPGVGTAIGAGVGAVAGAVIGLAKAGKNKTLEDRRIQKERNDALKKAKFDRENAQKLFGEQQAIEKQNSIVEAQKAILKSKY